VWSPSESQMATTKKKKKTTKNGTKKNASLSPSARGKEGGRVEGGTRITAEKKGEKRMHALRTTSGKPEEKSTKGRRKKKENSPNEVPKE